eukprot:scaffold58492_cov16-Tisochrysis_lutea.AAC.1
MDEGRCSDDELMRELDNDPPAQPTMPQRGACLFHQHTVHSVLGEVTMPACDCFIPAQHAACEHFCSTYCL